MDTILTTTGNTKGNIHHGSPKTKISQNVKLVAASLRYHTCGSIEMSQAHLEL